MDQVSSRELDSRSIERIVEHRRGSKFKVNFFRAQMLSFTPSLRKCSPLFEEATEKNERTYVN